MMLLKRIWNKLDLRLIILVVLVSVLPLVILGVFALNRSQRTLENQQFAHLNAVALLKADEIERWIESNVRHLNALAQRPLVGEIVSTLTTNELDAAATQSARYNLLANHLLPTLADEDGFWELFLLNVENGQVVASTHEDDLGKFRNTESYFIEGQTAAYVQNVYYKLTLGRPVMTIGTPVRNAQGAVVAVLAGHLDLGRLSTITAQASELTDTEDTYLVNNFNFFVTDPRFGENFALREAIYSEAVTRCLQQESGRGVYEDYRGDIVLGAYQWLPQRELCVITEIDQAEALGAISTLRRSLFSVGILVAVGVVTSGLFFPRSITNPLRRLVKGTQHVGQGELDYQIPVPGEDDIGLLTAAFNQMTSDLRRSVGETQHSQHLMFTLSQAAQAVQKASTPQQVYEAMGTELSRLGFDTSVLMLTEDGRRLRVGYMSYDTAVVRKVEKLGGLSVADYEYPLPAGGYFERIVQNGETIFIPSMGAFLAEAISQSLRPMANRLASMLGMERGIAAPLIVDDATIGLLSVTGDNLSESDVTAVSTFASQMAIALQNAQSLAQLRQNEARFRAIFEYAGIGIARVDMEGKPMESNPALQAMVGYSADELQQMTFPEFTHPEDVEKDLSLYQSLVAGEREAYQIDKRYIHKDGSVIWARLIVSLVTDEDGQPQFAIGMVNDITVEKEAQEALRRHRDELEELVAERAADLKVSEARYRTLAESSPDMIFLITPDMTIDYVNRKAAEQFGKNAEEVIGGPHVNLFPPEIAEQQQQGLGYVLQSGEMLQAESKAVFPDHEAWLHTRLVPIKEDDGRTTAVLGVSRDITEIKEAELALEKKATDLERSNQELEQFAYVASHDLQEPLRMVSSYMQLLQRRYGGQLDERADTYIDFAVDGATRMKSLVDDLLTFSRVGTRAKPLAPVHVGDVLKRVLNDLQFQIEDTGAEVSHDPLPTVMADNNQLGQLFQNLIANGLKFSGAERPRVHIGVDKVDDMWRFCVEDNGIGFDPEYAERIFVIFKRLHNREEYSGTGIGLAVCKKIVERHGGEIWAESQPGAGAKFYFTLYPS